MTLGRHDFEQKRHFFVSQAYLHILDLPELAEVPKRVIVRIGHKIHSEEDFAFDTPEMALSCFYLHEVLDNPEIRNPSLTIRKVLKKYMGKEKFEKWDKKLAWKQFRLTEKIGE